MPEFQDNFYRDAQDEALEEFINSVGDDICTECDGEGTVHGHLCKSCQGSGRK